MPVIESVHTPCTFVHDKRTANRLHAVDELTRRVHIHNASIDQSLLPFDVARRECDDVETISRVQFAKNCLHRILYFTPTLPVSINPISFH